MLELPEAAPRDRAAARLSKFCGAGRCAQDGTVGGDVAQFLRDWRAGTAPRTTRDPDLAMFAADQLGLTELKPWTSVPRRAPRQARYDYSSWS